MKLTKRISNGYQLWGRVSEGNTADDFRGSTERFGIVIGGGIY
jgi:hypothetical protein